MFPPSAPFFCTHPDPANRGLRSGKARLRPPALPSFELLAKGIGLDEVHEFLPPVDRDDRNQIPVASLKIGVAINFDFCELEAELGM
jgi:hypothetical protein